MIQIITPPPIEVEIEDTPPAPVVNAAAVPARSAPSGRRQLPAYGKQLLLDRRAGKHPHTVTLSYGARWWHGSPPLVGIDPQNYEPGKFDFRMVTGLRVKLVDQDGAAEDCAPGARPPAFGKFYELLRELGEADAFVVVYFSPLQVGVGSATVTRPSPLAEIALCNRWFDREAQTMRWPCWWSGELQAKQERREDLWLADFEAGRRRFVEQKQAERERVRAA